MYHYPKVCCDAFQHNDDNILKTHGQTTILCIVLRLKVPASWYSLMIIIVVAKY